MFLEKPKRDRIEFLVNKVNEVLRSCHADPVETYLVSQEIGKMTVRYLNLDLPFDMRAV